MSSRSRVSLSRRRVLAGLGTGLSTASIWGLAPLIATGSVTSESPRVVGHRGAEGLAPPNTRAAIREALAVGVDGVELDVRRTLDGELVLFHDPILDWDSTGRGWIQNTTWDEIDGATIDGEPLLTLSQGLAELASTDVTVYLELKAPGYTDSVIETVADHGLLDQSAVIAFDESALEPARDAGVTTGLIGSLPTPGLVDEATACGADLVFSHYAPRGVSNFVSAARDESITAGVWKLVDTRQTIRDVLEIDFDVLVTNRPDYAYEVLRGES
ncbi:glycerophosphodiester phosphodiesterase [Natronococcus wangiae]|uniref:glycerophosphodiester phosphodiesterase n=1 Tax=Natronococcus wangiae TaxID=3068275 RepID=UPI00273D6EC2|nr:glycerophosphodiester phosphodiesterase family protein [Natronococcus sp. AD5]